MANWNVGGFCPKELSALRLYTLLKEFYDNASAYDERL